MKFLGPVRFILRGDPSKAKEYTGLARKFLGMAKLRMGQDKAYWTRTLPDGTTIIVSSLGGVDQIWITSKSGGERLRLEHAYVYTTTSYDDELLWKDQDLLWNRLTIVNNYDEKFPVPIEYGTSGFWTDDLNVVTWDFNNIYSQGYKIAEAPSGSIEIQFALIRNDYIVILISTASGLEVLRRKLERGTNVGGDRFDPISAPTGWESMGTVSSSFFSLSSLVGSVTGNRSGSLLALTPSNAIGGEDYLDIRLVNPIQVSTSPGIPGTAFPTRSRNVSYEYETIFLVETRRKVDYNSPLSQDYLYSINRFFSGNKLYTVGYSSTFTETFHSNDIVGQFSNKYYERHSTESKRAEVSIAITSDSGDSIFLPISIWDVSGISTTSFSNADYDAIDAANPTWTNDEIWAEAVSSHTTTITDELLLKKEVQFFLNAGIVALWGPLNPVQYLNSNGNYSTTTDMQLEIIDLSNGDVLFSKIYENDPIDFSISGSQNIISDTSPNPNWAIYTEPPDGPIPATPDFDDSGSGVQTYSDEQIITMISNLTALQGASRLPDKSVSGIIARGSPGSLDISGFITNPEKDLDTLLPDFMSKSDLNQVGGVFSL